MPRVVDGKSGSGQSEGPRTDIRWWREIGQLRRRGDWSRVALLEGPHLVHEALAAGIALQRVFVTRAWAESPAAAPILRMVSVPPITVDGRTLAHLADSDAPQGVLALAVLARPGAAALPTGGSTYLYADAVQDPGNVGALARVAEGAGASGLALGAGSAHPNHPRALRASAGSLLRLPVAWRTAPAEVDGRLGTTDASWILLDPHAHDNLFGTSTRALPRPRIVAVGSESRGFSAELTARASRRFRIPLHPPVESLNVATAAAVALFQLRS